MRSSELIIGPFSDVIFILFNTENFCWIMMTYEIRMLCEVRVWTYEKGLWDDSILLWKWIFLERIVIVWEWL